jgi:hypothetical protein
VTQYQANIKLIFFLADIVRMHYITIAQCECAFFITNFLSCIKLQTKYLESVLHDAIKGSRDDLEYISGKPKLCAGTLLSLGGIFHIQRVFLKACYS